MHRLLSLPVPFILKHLEASRKEKGKHANQNRPCLEDNLDTFLISRIQEGIWFSDCCKPRRSRKVVPVPNFSLCLLCKICLYLMIASPIYYFQSLFIDCKFTYCHTYTHYVPDLRPC